MKLSVADLKKLEFDASASRSDVPKNSFLTGIFKVRLADYVPAKVHLRARIDPMLFTGSFVAGDLSALEADPNVVSVSLAKKLPSVE